MFKGASENDNIDTDCACPSVLGHVIIGFKYLISFSIPFPTHRSFTLKYCIRCFRADPTYAVGGNVPLPVQFNAPDSDLYDDVSISVVRSSGCSLRDCVMGIGWMAVIYSSIVIFTSPSAFFTNLHPL